MEDQGSPQSFWHSLTKLVGSSNIVIDRPRGSRHPRYPGMIYPLDYGYLKGTRSGDGAGIDVWVGHADAPEVTGIVCTVDVHQRDAEIKVLLGCTESDIEEVTSFHNQGSQAAFVVLRPS